MRVSDARQAVKLVSENMVWRKDQLGLKLWEIQAATSQDGRVMDAGNLSRIINGKREASTDQLIRLARVFDIDEFIDWYMPHASFKRKYAKRTKRVEIVVKGPYLLEAV